MILLVIHLRKTWLNMGVLLVWYWSSNSLPPDGAASQDLPRSWSSPSRLSSSPRGVSVLPPDAGRESASGSSPPHGRGSCLLSFYPKHSGKIKVSARCSVMITGLRVFTYLSVETEFLDLIDAVDHHVHQRKQSVHVFGRSVAHTRHCTQKHTHCQTALNLRWVLELRGQNFLPLNVNSSVFFVSGSFKGWPSLRKQRQNFQHRIQSEKYMGLKTQRDWTYTHSCITFGPENWSEKWMDSILSAWLVI